MSCHLIGYARVSTGEQDTARQVNALKAAGCARIFIDHASGAKRDRAELKAALDTVRAGDVFVVLSIDRLARSLRDLMEIYEDHLVGRGVAFRSLQESADTTTPAGLALFQMLGVFAQFERSIIQGRVKSGLEAKRVKGRNGELGPSGRKLAGHGGRIAKLGPDDRAAIKEQMARHPRRSQARQSAARDLAKRYDVGVSTVYHVTTERPTDG